MKEQMLVLFVGLLGERLKFFGTSDALTLGETKHKCVRLDGIVKFERRRMIKLRHARADLLRLTARSRLLARRRIRLPPCTRKRDDIVSAVSRAGGARLWLRAASRRCRVSCTGPSAPFLFKLGLRFLPVRGLGRCRGASIARITQLCPRFRASKPGFVPLAFGFISRDGYRGGNSWGAGSS